MADFEFGAPPSRVWRSRYRKFKIPNCDQSVSLARDLAKLSHPPLPTLTNSPIPRATVSAPESRAARPRNARHPASDCGGLVDLAFEQLRQYSRNDMAVALQLLRAFAEVGQATEDPAVHDRLKNHARPEDTAVRPNFAPVDCDELDTRLAAVAALGTLSSRASQV
jgi:hypothetical protein